MLQLRINGTAYPEVRNGAYTCYRQDLGESDRMISNRLVTESQGSVWVIEYNVDCLENDFMRKCLADLRAGKELTVDFLTPEADELKTATFRCTKSPAPNMEWSFGGKALWKGISFKLEQSGGES